MEKAPEKVLPSPAAPAPRAVAETKAWSPTLPDGRPWYADDVHAPEPHLVVVVLTPRLVLERSDPNNWTLLERKLTEGSGANAGSYRWVKCGYYKTPAMAFPRAVNLAAEHNLGEKGMHSLKALVEALEQASQGIRPEVEKGIREHTLLQSSGREEGIVAALQVLEKAKKDGVKDLGELIRMVKKLQGGNPGE